MYQFLVRHAQSSSNLEQRVQGQLDVPLSDFGRRQTLALATWALPRDIEEVWSSPLARARHTAEAIAIAIGRKVNIDERLKELDAGIFQGHLWCELEKTKPEEVAAWRSGDPSYAMPGGESRNQLARRGCEVLRELAQRPAKNIVVVAHGGILAASLGSLFARINNTLIAEGIAMRSPLVLHNASVSLLEWPGPRLAILNNIEHLHSEGVASIDQSGLL